jgi:pimeloyl-ACP methyl ester carboxylesterase
MKIVDQGSGAPLVVIPGIQGRWEWMRPGIEALAASCRVVTFSLCDEPCSDARFDEREGFACYVDQVRDALDQARLERAAICGVSYGGLIAAAFATRYPSRVSALVLASAVPPGWTPNRRARAYLRAPRLLAPLFWLTAPLHMQRELAAAIPCRRDRLHLAASSCLRFFRHPPGAARMARRARLAMQMAPPDLSGLRVPALVVTGEADLDRIVAVASSRHYARLIPHTRVATLARTGHLGMVTRPGEFAAIVTTFVHEHAA